MALASTHPTKAATSRVEAVRGGIPSRLDNGKQGRCKAPLAAGWGA